MEQLAKKNQIHILHFMLQDIQLGLDLSVVKKIIPLALIEKVPKSLPYMVGVMNLAGKSVPIMDLALRLELNRKDIYSLDVPIILCQQGMSEIGLVVDKIMGIEVVDKNLLQENLDFLDKYSPVYGVIHLNNVLILMLDAIKILDKNISINNNSMMNKLTYDERIK